MLLLPTFRQSAIRGVSRSIISRRVLLPLAHSRFYAATPADELKKTPLYNLHVQKGAKMVPFAGYSMPVTYSSQSLTDSHNHVRTKAGLFDVSHMVQHR